MGISFGRAWEETQRYYFPEASDSEANGFLITADATVGDKDTTSTLTEKKWLGSVTFVISVIDDSDRFKLEILKADDSVWKTPISGFIPRTTSVDGIVFAIPIEVPSGYKLHPVLTNNSGSAKKVYGAFNFIK